MASVPAEYHDLFEKRTYAHLATVFPNGAPHVTPVWIDYDEESGRLLVNTERGRQKERNVRENPTVGLSMLDPDDPYRYLSIVGTVAEVTTEGARDHIDELAGRYTGTAEYDTPIQTERVILEIDPERVIQ